MTWKYLCPGFRVILQWPLKLLTHFKIDVHQYHGFYIQQILTVERIYCKLKWHGMTNPSKGSSILVCGSAIPDIEFQWYTSHHLTQESHKSTHVVGCQPELVFENWVNLEETKRQHPNLYGQWTIDVVLFQWLIISWYAFLPCRPWFQDLSIYLDVSEHGVYPPIYRYFNG